MLFIKYIVPVVLRLRLLKLLEFIILFRVVPELFMAVRIPVPPVAPVKLIPLIELELIDNVEAVPALLLFKIVTAPEAVAAERVPELMILLLIFIVVVTTAEFEIPV